VAGPDLLSYLRDSGSSGPSSPGSLGSSGPSGSSGSGMTLVAYSPLIGGGYVRSDKPLGAEFDHPGTERRLFALRAVAAETGATVNQVVLAWLMGGELPVIPLVGASSVAQLEESLGAVELELSAEQRSRLDAAG
jgi:aryl-alcohol dehydrogenase-like predicted oxidoreductase